MQKIEGRRVKNLEEISIFSSELFLIALYCVDEYGKLEILHAEWKYRRH